MRIRLIAGTRTRPIRVVVIVVGSTCSELLPVKFVLTKMGCHASMNTKPTLLSVVTEGLRTISVSIAATLILLIALIEEML